MASAADATASRHRLAGRAAFLAALMLFLGLHLAMAAMAVVVLVGLAIHLGFRHLQEALGDR